MVKKIGINFTLFLIKKKYLKFAQKRTKIFKKGIDFYFFCVIIVVLKYKRSFLCIFSAVFDMRCATQGGQNDSKKLTKNHSAAPGQFAIMVTIANTVLYKQNNNVNNPRNVHKLAT